MTTKVLTKLSWNFKKANWPGITNLLDNELHTCPLNFNQHHDKLCNDITNIMIRCAKKTIPRGKTKHYRVFWSKHLEELKRSRDALRNTADQTEETKLIQMGIIDATLYLDAPDVDELMKSTDFYTAIPRSLSIYFVVIGRPIPQ
ncbi:unnamed protein product [Rodentolepis nana]|uniref:Reverse transcriptase domain-containing protein n=1 Tax=Rodentolepis nana TaxID=102285 RepID=A0A0R3T6L4_RODNA|nr:unnamed protein product [Rodentolepis nana]